MSTPTSPQNASIGAALRAMREGLGLSRRYLAERAEVDHSHLARVESGERSMSEPLLARVVQAMANHLNDGAAA